MRSRAALLPHPADPFMLKYWLKFFNEVWQDEVDRLYIYINSPIEMPVIDYMLDLCRSNDKIQVTYFPTQIEHGEAINRLLDVVKEEYVMLIEDDGFIFRRGMVDKCFTALENGSYDIVGSARGSCSLPIYEMGRMQFDLDYSGLGDHGCNFWPCFFFTKKQTLIDTDRNFGARGWKRGEQIEPLGYCVAEEILVGDTFVNTSLQLRAKYPKQRILMVPQYHGSPDDIEHAQRRYNLFDGEAPWCHIGSLSSGTHGILTDDQGRSLARRLIDPPKESAILPDYCRTEQEKLEWERRVQWWKTFYDNAGSTTIPEFKDLYLAAIQRIIRQFGLREGNILKRQEIYKAIGL